MGLHKDLFVSLLSGTYIDKFPDLPCPGCSKVSLKLSRREIKWRKSKRQYDPSKFSDDDFDSGILLGFLKVVGAVFEQAQWVQSRFTGFLKCANCDELVAVIGRGRQPTDYAKRTYGYSQELFPEYFSPPIPLFELKSEFPDQVKLELVKSFATYFSDAALSGSRMRVSVELLLDHLGIEKYRKDKTGETIKTQSGKNQKLSLDARIKVLSDEYADYSKSLLAIKSIGNEASHNTEIDRRDLLDAYQILDHVLTQIFVVPRINEEMEKLTSDVETKYS